MIRTQIQLPDQLYERARQFAEARELSLAEVARRGIESFLDRYPDPAGTNDNWELPILDLGGIRVPLEQLRDFLADDESLRGLSRSAGTDLE